MQRNSFLRDLGVSPQATGRCTGRTQSLERPLEVRTVTTRECHPVRNDCLHQESSPGTFPLFEGRCRWRRQSSNLLAPIRFASVLYQRRTQQMSCLSFSSSVFGTVGCSPL